MLLEMSLFKRRVGVLTRELRNIGGNLGIGEEVIYYRSRKCPYRGGSVKRYEWCYERLSGGLLIRTNGRYIEGKEEIIED